MSGSTANFVHALLAVVLGNLAYFVAMRFLPATVRHAPFHFDLGLVVDFCLCVVVFGLIKALAGKRRR